MSTRSAMRLGLAGLVLALSAGAAQAITIEVYPSSAPNAYGSPSFFDNGVIPGYQSNAISAIGSGLSTYGNPALPTYYSRWPSSTLTVADNIVTGFPSWRGQADPGTAFGAAYASELGNRMTFGVHILGNGTQFSISQMSFAAQSTDGNSLGFSWATGSYNYSAGYVGVIYGDVNTYVTDGPNTQLVDELIGRGSGNAWAAYLTDPGGVTPQDKINNAVQSIWDSAGDAPFDFTATYTLNVGNGVSGSATVEFVGTGLPAEAPGAVPEPASASLALGGLLALAGFAIRRRGA
jgi:hypothetical protein